VVEGFRWALLGRSAPPETMLIVSVATTAILLAGGLFYFTRMEKTFPDII
jgi:lipopolysaccharide transport system permease protein